MKFHEWEPVYTEILREFGYSRSMDERARDHLMELTTGYCPEKFSRGTSVGIAGGAGSLTDELSRLRDVDSIIAVSNAAEILRDEGISFEMMVTDLDKVPKTVKEVTRDGTCVVVHAHGDNIQAIKSWVPEFDREFVLPTTQAEPTHHVRNFGGFTDGDRAAFLADALGAGKLVFVGWDFDDVSVSTEKRKKLEWAERLLRWLEIRRNESFGVLDGRRESIDLSTIPVR